MLGQSVRWGLVIAFAVTVGHLAWNSLIGPPSEPDYCIGGYAPALVGSDPNAKVLYLRRELFLPRRPRHAWLQLVGHDRVRVFVNGRLLQDRKLDGFPVGIVADAT